MDHNYMDNGTQCDWTIYSNEIEFFLYPHVGEIFLTLVYPIVSAFGLLLNGMFVCILLRVKEMRTITFFFLANLAACDISILLISLIRTITSYFNSPVELEGFAFNSGIACSLALVGGYLFEYVGAFMIFLSTLDRYLAICKPFAYRSFTCKENGIILTAVCWMVSLAFALFEVDYSLTEVICLQWPDNDTFTEFPTRINGCSGRTWWAPLVTVGFDMFLFVGVAVSCLFFSISILVKIKLKESDGDTPNLPQIKAAFPIVKVRLQIGRMVVANTLTFLLLLTPFQFFNLDWYIYHINGDSFFPYWLVLLIPSVTSAIKILNSTVNPLIYMIMSQRVRLALKDTIPKVN